MSEFGQHPLTPKDVATKAYVDDNWYLQPTRWAWKFKVETSDSRRDNLAAGEFIGPVIGSSSTVATALMLSAPLSHQLVLI